MRVATHGELIMLARYAIDGRDHETPPTKCGKCGNIWTLSTGEKLQQELPQPGAFCVCAFCGAICQYDEQMQGRVLAAKDLRQLPRAFRRKLQELSSALVLMDHHTRARVN